MATKSSILRPLFQLRWILARPLQERILPKWLPVIPLPFVKLVPYLTVGQIVLTIPLLVLFFAGWDTTFVNPSIEDSGYVASYAILATFLLSNKSNSVFTFLFGLSFERLVPFHNLASILAVVLSFFHGYVAFKYGDSGDSSDRRRLSSSSDSQYSMAGLNTNLWKFCWDGSVNMSGSLIIVSMLGLVIFSFFLFFRHYNFDLWLLSHILFSVGVIAFSLMHEVTNVGIVLVWWVLDLVLRYIVMTQCRYKRKATITRLSDDLVEVRFSRNKLRFEAGQFIRIAVPELGSWQFHACTISSAPYEENVTLHFKVLGGWTRRLIELAARKDEISVLLEGPYGSLSMDLVDDKRYPFVFVVGGGIGITPCRSIARQLFHEYQQKRRQLQKLRVVWTARDVSLVQALPILDDRKFRDNAFEGNGALQTDIFITKSRNVDCELAGLEGIHGGRPDLLAILSELEKEALDNGVVHVAVVCCGPAALVEDLKLLCRKHSKYALQCGGVCFDFHEDIFAY